MKQNKGFTLIELVVTIAIGAIVLTMGVPSFQNVILNNRLVTQTNTLVSALTFARTEAIKNGTNTTICPISDTDGACGTNWAKGWIVFSDSNNDQSVNGSDTVWLVNDKFKGKKLSYSSGNTLTFDSKGLLRSTNFGAFSLCVDDDHVRSIDIALTGRAEVEKTSGDSCS